MAADKPILILPAATVVARQAPFGGYPGPRKRPSQQKQSDRLSPAFRSLAASFSVAPDQSADVSPELVLVFETIGSQEDLANIAKRIPGMEWLGQFDTEVTPDDKDFLEPDEASSRASLVAVGASREAVDQLLALWAQWTESSDAKLPRPFGALADVFRHLNSIRQWSAQDRIADTAMEAFLDSHARNSNEPIRLEIELWHRSSAAARSAAFTELEGAVSSLGGRCVSQATIAEIAYHGILVELPGQSIVELLRAIRDKSALRLLDLRVVRSFSPVGQVLLSQGDTPAESVLTSEPLPSGPPVVALLDGLPEANHSAIEGRVTIDDPDDIAARYNAGEHVHGTGMASLITRGELGAGAPPLSTPLYCRPLLAPANPDFDSVRHETFLPDSLPVDLLHRIVLRMLQGESGAPPTAPSVRVINLSVGDRDQPFLGRPSSLARMIDWLSYRFGVLFVVSAGNHSMPITLPFESSALATTPPDDLRVHTLSEMIDQRNDRRLLAPAESINALTVGPLHAQSAAYSPQPVLHDLVNADTLPSPYSTVATGIRKSIKPDILVPGGKQHYMVSIAGGSGASSELVLKSIANQPGQTVAAPDRSGTSNTKTRRACGSSNAAALTTREAAFLIDRLSELSSEPGGQLVSATHYAVLLKALLAHGCSWRDAEQLIDSRVVSDPNWQVKKHFISMLVGYGAVDFEGGTTCTEGRAILIGAGSLEGNKAHEYSVPLPRALHAQTIKRRTSITLAWMSPTNARHRSYRGAQLWFDPPKVLLKSDRRDASPFTARNGTLQHEVLEGERALVVGEEESFTLQVNCRPDALSRLDEPIRYAIVVTLETASPLGISLYDEIRARVNAVHAPVAIVAGATNQ